MNFIVKIIFFCLVVFVLSRCNRGDTTWEPEYAFPIAKGELSFDDIQENDYLYFDEDVVRVHYYDTLAPINLSELINLGDTVLEASYTSGVALGPIPFENSNEIFGLDEDFEFNLDDALLRYGKIKTGTLRVEFESDVDGYLDLRYTLPGIRLNGEELSLVGQTNPASTLNPYSNELLVDISGYEIDFTGTSGTERNTLIGNLSVATSASPSYTAQVYGSDLVTVKMELLELEVQELRGYFGQWDREINEEIVLDSSIYQGGTVSLSELDASLEFINNFGVDAQIQLNDISTLNSITANQVQLQTDNLYSLLNISRAQETTNGVIPSSVSFDFGGSSNLSEALAVTPNRIAIQGDAVLNPLGDVSGGFDFFIEEYPFQMVADISFPLCLGIENLILQDSLILDLEAEENIKALTLTATLTNYFGVGFDFEVSFPNEDEPFWSSSLIPEVDDIASEHQIVLELTEGNLESLYNSEFLIIKVIANTANGEEVKFLTSDKIDVLITGKVTYGVKI